MSRRYNTREELIPYPLTERVCANCRHFHQHYVQSDKNPTHAVPIAMGHCSYPRVKDRNTGDICHYFEYEEE